MQVLPTNAGPAFTISCRGRAIRAVDRPVVRHAAAEFGGGFEEGTLRFFDATLPRCDRMIDCGAYIGFTSLYAASQVASVHAFEASPTNFGLLTANLALNPELAPRITTHHLALGDHDGDVTMYRKGMADSGTSIFRDVERAGVIRGQAEAVVPMRDAAVELGGLSVDSRTLIKIDIEGAEYQVIPALAPLFAAQKPFVHVSFHPFNIVISDDPYVNAVARLRSALVVAETLASYRFMHVFTRDGWVHIDPPSRMHFLRHYLLTAKQVPRCPTPYYGFTDAVGFSDEELSGLDD